MEVADWSGSIGSIGQSTTDALLTAFLISCMLLKFIHMFMSNGMVSQLFAC